MNSTGQGISIGHDNTPLWRTSNYGDTWTGPPSGALSSGYTVCWKKENQDFLIGAGNGIVRWGAATGWGETTINTSGISTTAIDFLNDNLGVVGCSQGQVLKTTDGGITWTNCNYPGFQSIKKVQILNENLIFADGYKSTDGGVTWQSVNFGNIIQYHFFNSVAGYGVNSLKQVFRTLDGGLNWVSLNSGQLTFSESYFNEIYFATDKVIGLYNNSDIYVFSIQNPLSLEEMNSALGIDIQVFPNPSKSYVNVKCNFPIESLELFDVNGRLLNATLCDGIESIFDVSNYAKGVYLLKINTDNGAKTEKIVKE